MKEATGGIFSLEFIIVFLLILNGYMAFNVNYTKAFRVKNEIRSIIQKNEGLTDSAMEQIEEYMDKVNYTQSKGFNDYCQNRGMYTCTINGRSFCMDVTTSDKYGTRETASGTENIAAYYTITTFVDINIPVINKFFDRLGGLFAVSGETSLIYTKETAFTDSSASAGRLGIGNCVSGR